MSELQGDKYVVISVKELQELDNHKSIEFIKSVLKGLIKEAIDAQELWKAARELTYYGINPKPINYEYSSPTDYINQLKKKND